MSCCYNLMLKFKWMKANSIAHLMESLVGQISNTLKVMTSENLLLCSLTQFVS